MRRSAHAVDPQCTCSAMPALRAHATAACKLGCGAAGAACRGGWQAQCGGFAAAAEAVEARWSKTGGLRPAPPAAAGTCSVATAVEGVRTPTERAAHKTLLPALPCQQAVQEGGLPVLLAPGRGCCQLSSAPAASCRAVQWSMRPRSSCCSTMLCDPGPAPSHPVPCPCPGPLPWSTPAAEKPGSMVWPVYSPPATTPLPQPPAALFLRQQSRLVLHAVDAKPEVPAALLSKHRMGRPPLPPPHPWLSSWPRLKSGRYREKGSIVVNHRNNLVRVCELGWQCTVQWTLVGTQRAQQPQQSPALHHTALSGCLTGLAAGPLAQQAAAVQSRVSSTT